MELKYTVMSSFETTIKKYLDNRAKEDSLFAETYKKANKSIKECCKYIYSQARKMAKGSNSVGIDDATVFGWAVHYYDEDNIEVEGVKEQVEVVTPVTTPAPSEKSIQQKPARKKTKQELFDERQLSLFSFDA